MEANQGFQSLVQALHSPEKEDARKAAHQLGDLGDSEAVPYLLQTLMTTDDHGLRDAAAVALRELRDSTAAPFLASLLRDPKTEGHRSSLVYALQTLNPIEQLPLLVELVATGNWEVSREALMAIEGIEGTVPTSIWDSCMEKVASALKTATGDREQLLKELSEMFSAES